MPAVLMR